MNHPESLKLLLLTDPNGPDWEGQLRACLMTAGLETSLYTAPNWRTAETHLHAQDQVIVLAPESRMPQECPYPLVQLLLDEPRITPHGCIDWLVYDELTPATLKRLTRYIRGSIQIRQRVQTLSEVDFLTQIPNRQGFNLLLKTRLQESGGLGLVMGHIDLDNFKHVNETMGHNMGDQLIKQVVGRLKSCLENGDFMARLGSDEFALLVDIRRNPQRLHTLGENITQVLSEPYWIGNSSLLMGCSLGLSESHGMVIDSWMWEAHSAMQEAKRIQGCTYKLYDEHVGSHARLLSELESDLRQGLKRDELELHYQPRLSLAQGKIVGLEALVRWRHPERGLLSPNEFIPLAEESGLIVPLGYWIIGRALRDLQWLRGRGLSSLHMAVNLSFRQFQDSNLLSTMKSLIKERGIDGCWLEFELTETAIMRRSDQVKRTMDALNNIGVKFSLDDFGTGFSSFVHLNSLPITLLKIDKSFVGGMPEREENCRLVRAMVNLAINLNLEVVAEGVENLEQLQLLNDFNCHQAQGYLISKPLPLHDLARFMVFGLRHLKLQKSIELINP